MLTIEKLRNYGANVDEGLARCLNNESFYLRLVNMVINDKNFSELENAINQNDLKKAFEAAHALKGSIGNLSITPIYDAVVEITELLRNQTATNYQPYLTKILDLRQKLVDLVD